MHEALSFPVSCCPIEIITEQFEGAAGLALLSCRLYVNLGKMFEQSRSELGLNARRLGIATAGGARSCWQD